MKKEDWPDFPYFWMDKPDMSSLQEIASRLKEKVDSFTRSGFVGETTPMEKQIIEHLSGLHQQVLELHDAIQASLQIIDDQRPSVRARKAVKRFRERIMRLVGVIRENTVLTILGAVSTLAFVITVVVYILHQLSR